MLTKKQIMQIKEHLERAQNPVFFFDNDPDGLCSFLLLQRYVKRGRGIAIKAFPEMTEEYFRKVTELNADYIFILDKPLVSKEFFKEVKKLNIPVVWIDHHDVQVRIPNFVYYYNTALNRFKKNEPVTYLCYKITNKKEDLWLAVIGCIFDRYIPDFYSEFCKEYPDLAIKGKDAFDIFYKSQIGRITKMFCFALKDRTSNVIKMIKFLTTARNPYEILEENSKNHLMHQRFKQIQKKYKKLLEKAKKLANEDKILFFRYAGDLSISADLSNELSYLFPQKVIVVVYIMGMKANISVRGKRVRDLISRAIEGIEGATSGGHENAVGSRMRVENLEKFRKNLEELIKTRQ
jgi:single-stranded DNA-specific DHH superfamily exonuclease